MLFLYRIGIAVSLFVLCSADRVFQVDVNRTCAPGWKRTHDACYFFSETKKSYDQAKTACTDLSARLMIPRSREHLVAVINSAERVEYIIGLLQVPESSPKEGWVLQDGTDLKDDPLWCANEPNDAHNAETLLAFHGKDDCLNDMGLNDVRRYVCEKGLASRFIPDPTTPVEYAALFDGNQTSCVDTKQVLTSQERYVISSMNVTESREGDVFTVVYNNAVSCKMQKPLYAKQNTVCSNTTTLERCHWPPNGNDVNTSCQYKCVCSGKGCEAFLVDRRDKQERQSAAICEISVTESLNSN